MAVSTARLRDEYREAVIPKLREEFGYTNVHEIPRLEKVVINMGIGREAVQNSKAFENAASDLALISGQRPVVRRAKKSIANFKVRRGMVVGVSVTLRRERMYEFLDRLINIALPRVRDFRGLSRNGFDGHGNYSLGLSEQIIFPEISMEKSDVRGLSITVVTTAKSDAEGRALLEHLGFPFRK